MQTHNIITNTSMFVLQASCLANLSGFSKTKVLGFDVPCPWDTKSSWCSPAVAPDGHLVQDTAGGKSGSPETYTTRSWEVDSNLYTNICLLYEV